MNDENIEQILKRIGRQDMPADVQAMAEETAESFSKSFMPSRQHILWRTIVETKIAKPTAAAACAVITLVVVWLFFASSGSVPSAYAELIQAIENSTTVEWVHLSITEYAGQEENGKWTGVESTEIYAKEQWLSFRPFRVYSIGTTGVISLDDYPNRRGYAYDPKTNTLTIGYENGGEHMQEYSLRGAMNRFMSEFVTADVTKVPVRAGERALTAFYVQTSPYADRILWLVDPQTELILRFEKIDYEDKGKQVIIYDYPETGPADIYALGVPRDPEVVDLSPPPGIEDVVNSAREAQEKFPKTFFAIECRLLEFFEGHVPLERHPDGYMPFQQDTRLYDVNVQDTPAAVITVTYRKNYDARREIYPLWISEYSDLKDYREQLAQLIATIPFDSLDTLKAWTQDMLPSNIIILNERNTIHAFQLNPNETLKLDFDHYDPRDRAALLNINFWRPPNNRYDLDHYYKDVGQPSGQWGDLIGIAIGDEQAQCFFNPARDYICERILVDSTAPPRWRGHTKNVLEYAKISTSQWYPGKTRSVWDNATYLFVNYIDDTRKIDDKLFDPDAVSAADLATLYTQ